MHFVSSAETPNGIQRNVLGCGITAPAFVAEIGFSSVEND
jgi:hypothetical protein